MILRKSEAVLRMLIALALGAGFIGFATQGPTELAQAQAVEVAHSAHP